MAGKSAKVIKRLCGLTAIKAPHRTNGNRDLVADIRAANLAEFDHVLREVRIIDGVLNSETSLLLGTV